MKTLYSILISYTTDLKRTLTKLRIEFKNMFCVLSNHGSVLNSRMPYILKFIHLLRLLNHPQLPKISSIFFFILALNVFFFRFGT